MERARYTSIATRPQPSAQEAMTSREVQERFVRELPFIPDKKRYLRRSAEQPQAIPPDFPDNATLLRFNSFFPDFHRRRRLCIEAVNAFLETPDALPEAAHDFRNSFGPEQHDDDKKYEN
jgi:hypothetical protein